MKFLWIILVLLPTLCVAQQNLVPNPSFEEVSQCPETTSQVSLATPWGSTGWFIDNPDLYNTCSEPDFYPPDWYIPRQGVPENSVGYQHAHSGVGYAGIFTYGGQDQPNGREYLQVLLTEPLQTGGYVISFWASLADEFQYAVGSLGAYLSDTLVIRTDIGTLLEVEPSIQSPVGLVMSNKNIWYHVTDTFASRYGGEQYLLISNFKSTAESDTLLVPTGANNRFQSYYYIDDVSVVALEDTISSIEEAGRLQFNVYPNPSNGRFEVRASEPLRQEATLIVYDTQGRAVLRQQVQKGMSSTTVNTEYLAKGVYTLRLLSDDGSSGWEKVVVQ